MRPSHANETTGNSATGGNSGATFSDYYDYTELTTGRFRMSQSALLKHIFSIAGVLPATITGVLAVLFIAAGCIFDLRFIIVALMILFLAAPLIATLLYISHGMRPEVAINILPHTVRITPEGADITVYARAPQPASTDAENEDVPAETEIEKHFHYPAERLGKPVRTLRALIVPISGKSSGFLYIPYAEILRR